MQCAGLVFACIEERSSDMLYYSIVFLVLAIIAGIFGFSGVAGTATWISQVLFIIFLVLLVSSALFHLFRGRQLK